MHLEDTASCGHGVRSAPVSQVSGGDHGCPVRQPGSVADMIRSIGSPRLRRQPWATDTRDLGGQDPVYRVFMVVGAAVDNRKFGSWSSPVGPALVSEPAGGRAVPGSGLPALTPFLSLSGVPLVRVVPFDCGVAGLGSHPSSVVAGAAAPDWRARRSGTRPPPLGVTQLAVVPTLTPS